MSGIRRLSHWWSLSVITAAFMLVVPAAAMGAPADPAKPVVAAAQSSGMPVSLLAWITIGAVSMLIGLAVTRRRRMPSLPPAGDQTDVGTAA